MYVVGLTEFWMSSALERAHTSLLLASRATSKSEEKQKVGAAVLVYPSERTPVTFSRHCFTQLRSHLPAVMG